MTSTSKAPVLVVLQLTGGNDYLNTVIPYTNPLYWDYRPVVGIPEDKVLPLDDKAAFHPAMGPMKPIYERGDMAIIHGVGYPNAPRSHFRSMDIWHTCEPNKLGTEGWLGRATTGPYRRKMSRVLPKSVYRELSASLRLPCSGPSSTTAMRVINSTYISHAALRSASTGSQVPESSRKGSFSETWTVVGFLLVM